MCFVECLSVMFIALTKIRFTIGAYCWVCGCAGLVSDGCNSKNFLVRIQFINPAINMSTNKHPGII